jgi:hypothetical protein
MSIIEASSGTYRSRVDGTIVLSVEIEPRYRAEALALFGMPGTPMALAGLKSQSAKTEPKTEGGVGYWCWQAITLCRDEKFREWISTASLGTAPATTEAQAAEVIRRRCKVASRNEFDTDKVARDRFITLIQRPFKQWLAVEAA